MTECMFNRCDGSGRVQYGPCPCDDYAREKYNQRLARFYAAEKEPAK